MSVRAEHGDMFDLIPRLEAEGIVCDSCVCDPPYHLGPQKTQEIGWPSWTANTKNARRESKSGFMNQKWDGGDIAFRPETWATVSTILRPGAFLVAFGGTRTYHRLACAIEDAGFEIRDTIAWIYGSGMPKSLNVSKAIDKAKGAKRKVIGTGPTVRRIRPGADQHKDGSWEKLTDRTYTHETTEPATDEARRWEGWGTGLKPAFEPIIVARKPLIGTVVDNVLKHGTGALNIDECRIGYEDTPNPATNPLYRVQNGYRTAVGSDKGGSSFSIKPNGGEVTAHPGGRWPANLAHDGSDEVLALFPAKAGAAAPVTRRGSDKFRNTYGKFVGQEEAGATFHGDAGSAARFFFSAKAGDADRWGSRHPTVKPVELIRWLVRLVVPAGGMFIDPFAGSGTAAVAALAERRNAILIEREDNWFADIRERIAFYEGEGRHSLAAKAGRVLRPVAAAPLFDRGE